MPREQAAAPVVDAALDQADVLAQITASGTAWNEGDLPGHLALYDPAITFMTKDGPRPGVAAIEAAFSEKYFNEGKPKQQLSFERVEVRRLDEDAILSTGRFLLQGGGLEEQSGWFTLVWVRTEDGWRAVHDHSS